MKNTFKHILTAVAAIALSIPAFAQEQDWSAIKTDKTATYDAANDKVDITLETFVNGYKSNIWTPKTDDVQVPLDIVLVLDVSGSMDDVLGTYVKTNDSYSTVKNNLNTKDYYYYNQGWFSSRYVKINSINYHKQSITFWGETGWYVNDRYRIEENTDRIYELTNPMKRIDALKNACESFINKVAEESEEGSHQIAIVKFAGDINTETSNDMNGSTNYTQIVQGLTDSDKTDELIEAVNSLKTGGATRADYGLMRANAVLKSARADSKKLVVMFTDGNPTSSSSFSNTVANNAIKSADTLKTNNTTIYTVGVFDDEVDDKIDDYMNFVSSNYPNAKSMTNGGDRAKNENNEDEYKYYMTASNDEELNYIFETIAGEEAQNTGTGSSKGAGVNLGGEDTSVTLKDIVTSDFVIPQTNGVPTDITLTLIPVDSVKVKSGATRNAETHAPAYSDYEIIWATDPSKFETITPAEGQVTVDGNTLNVDGKVFDFSANWIGVEEKWTVGRTSPDEVSTRRGKKLVISFSVKPDPTQNGGKVYTNTDESGVYVGDENVTPQNRADYDVPKPVFVPANITIRKSGMLPGESAIFEVTATNEAGTYTKTYTVAMTANESGEMKDAVIMKVPIVTNPNAEANGEELDWIKYTVKETSWSWAYTSDQTSITKTMTNDPATHLFEFKNTPKSETPKHGEGNANNIFAK
ncbi:MAG: VWA domain-containing protein [Bacteroidales bacterium]|nr:VWA domain-containing protein [Bacteroidales bacterium]